MEGTSGAGGARVYRYPRWNLMGCQHTAGLLVMLAALWTFGLRSAGIDARRDPGLIITFALFVLMGIIGQIRVIPFYARQPTEFIVRDGKLEVYWRGKTRRFDLDVLSVGELEMTPAYYFRGVKVTTPDGSFYVMEHLKGFDEFMALLRKTDDQVAG